MINTSGWWMDGIYTYVYLSKVLYVVLGKNLIKR